MSNVAGKAYGMIVITPLAKRLGWTNKWVFRFGRSFPRTLAGLIGLKFIHFARWVIIPKDAWPTLCEDKEKLDRDTMLFLSNFNGTWDQYIDAFSDGIPTGLDLFWYKNARYPGSVPITPFKDYIRANQINCDFYYNATPGAAYRDIVSALRVKRALLELQEVYRDPDTSSEEFAHAYRTKLKHIQNDLTTQGFSPVASISTDVAEEHRQQFNALQNTFNEAWLKQYNTGEDDNAKH
ncbi:hypothetical protein [uncultured Erythrobacter sp.]|uniref:hypothetical protein n=1 Tax=uncultured Erythrobacter sp. TaxID=263913 RepID=UPI00262C4FA3|nr:hypothetical protein [uncultured Erythrobacter sp.]